MRLIDGRLTVNESFRGRLFGAEKWRNFAGSKDYVFADRNRTKDIRLADDVETDETSTRKNGTRKPNQQPLRTKTGGESRRKKQWLLDERNHRIGIAGWSCAFRMRFSISWTMKRSLDAKLGPTSYAARFVTISIARTLAETR